MRVNFFRNRFLNHFVFVICLGDIFCSSYHKAKSTTTVLPFSTTTHREYSEIISNKRISSKPAWLILYSTVYLANGNDGFNSLKKRTSQPASNVLSSSYSDVYILTLHIFFSDFFAFQNIFFLSFCPHFYVTWQNKKITYIVYWS